MRDRVRASVYTLCVHLFVRDAKGYYRFDYAISSGGNKDLVSTRWFEF